MPKKSQYDWNLAEHLYEQGLVDRQIAEQLGPKCTPKTVCVWRYINDYPPNCGILPRKYPKITKWDNIDFSKIIELREQGLIDREIAEKIGCLVYLVGKWRRRHGKERMVGK